MYTNRYIFIYSIVMVVVVAAILSSAASFLRPIQEENERTEKMSQILSSVKIEADKDNAQELYDKYIVREEAINMEGEVVSVYENGQQVKGDLRPFRLNLREELYKERQIRAGKGGEEPRFPVYICNKNNETYYIVPLYGKGLWGPLWGDIALEDDLNTVYGVTFGHKSETPGLGAEINTLAFQEQFYGKMIFENEVEFTSIEVVKGGVEVMPEDRRIHGVDAISGGTITSNGVTDMLKDCLGNYLDYFKKLKNNGRSS